MPVYEVDTPLAPHAALLLSELAPPRPTTILDVGANPINACPYAPLLAAGGCHVIGFEPQPDAFARLQRDKGPNETYHPHAVGDGGLHTLNIYESTGFTSLFRPHDAAARFYGPGRWARRISLREAVPLQTVALDAMPDLAPFDLLKIDIQGGEVMVFDNATRVMAEAVAVIVELRYLQLYEDEPMMGGVDNSLRSQGFQLHKFLFNKSKGMASPHLSRLKPRYQHDQLIDGDAVYLRHPGKIDLYTDAQVMHLAILAASVFSSHSIVLFALEELIARGLVPRDLPERYLNALPPELLADPTAPVPSRRRGQRRNAPARIRA